MTNPPSQFYCEPCKRQFPNKLAIAVHNSRKHKVRPPESKPKFKHKSMVMNTTGIRFCPGCGLDIHKINHVVALMRKGAL